MAVYPYPWTEDLTPILLSEHASRHEDGGGDEISVDGLSGLLADDQHVLDSEVVSAIEAIVDDEPVDGATTVPISSNWASKQEEKNFLTDRIIKALLFALWQDVDWDEIDLWDIDWEEWFNT